MRAHGFDRLPKIISSSLWSVTMSNFCPYTVGMDGLSHMPILKSMLHVPFASIFVHIQLSCDWHIIRGGYLCFVLGSRQPQCKLNSDLEWPWSMQPYRSKRGFRLQLASVLKFAMPVFVSFSVSILSGSVMDTNCGMNQLLYPTRPWSFVLLMHSQFFHLNQMCHCVQQGWWYPGTLVKALVGGLPMGWHQWQVWWCRAPGTVGSYIPLFLSGEIKFGILVGLLVSQFHEYVGWSVWCWAFQLPWTELDAAP